MPSQMYRDTPQTRYAAPYSRRDAPYSRRDATFTYCIRPGSTVGYRNERASWQNTSSPFKISFFSLRKITNHCVDQSKNPKKTTLRRKDHSAMRQLKDSAQESHSRMRVSNACTQITQQYARSRCSHRATKTDARPSVLFANNVTTRP